MYVVYIVLHNGFRAAQRKRQMEDVENVILGRNLRTAFNIHR